MLVDGGHVARERARSRHEVRSTQRIVLGRFQAGDPALADAAVAAAKRAFPAWAATPWPERVDVPSPRGRADRGARLLHRRGARARSRQEPDGIAGRGAGDRRSHRLLLRPDGGERRLRASDGERSARRLREREHERAEAPRRLARDRAVQLSAGARRRAVGRRARRRQHGRLQGGVGDVVERTASRRRVSRRRDSARRVQLRHRAGRLARRSADPPSATSPASRSPARARSGCTCIARSPRERWPRPCIAEMGGKNAAIVTRRADLADAALRRHALGVRAVRSEVLGVLARVRRAHGIQRLRRAPARRRDEHRGRRSDGARELDGAGDRRRRGRAVRGRERADSRARRGRARSSTAANGSTMAISRTATTARRRSLARRSIIRSGSRSCSRRSCWWRRSRISTKRSRGPMRATYGLTAGFYGAPDEAERFFDGIEAGVCYANRPQGATTGAWPGYQPFGGWKGSGSTGKAGGSLYYLPQYLREQSQTRVRRA